MQASLFAQLLCLQLCTHSCRVSVLRLLVEVGLWLFTLDGGVQSIHIFLCVEALGVLHCVVSLQVERNHELPPNLITPGLWRPSQNLVFMCIVRSTVSLGEGYGKMSLC